MARRHLFDVALVVLDGQHHGGAEYGREQIAQHHGEGFYERLDQHVDVARRGLRGIVEQHAGAAAAHVAAAALVARPPLALRRGVARPPLLQARAPLRDQPVEQRVRLVIRAARGMLTHQAVPVAGRPLGLLL